MAQAKYVVTIQDDGSITTEPTEVTEGITRQATTFDIYQTSKELVSEIEQRLLADRVAGAVARLLQPVDASAEIKSKIIDALSDRGINPTVN
jgi:hypothetical protein